MIRFCPSFFFRHWILFLFGIVCACQAGDSSEEPSSPPNILFILTDDQGWGDLGSFFQNQRAEEGRPAIQTPHLDKMAEEGVRLTHHYCNAPVCAPSRASFLLGVHQGHSNVRDNQFDKRLEDNYTIGRVLQAAGYRTVVVGKWGLQGDGQWSEDGDSWPGHPLNRGFDEFYGYMRHRDGHEHYPVEGPYRGPKEVYHNREEISAGLDKCYTGDLWTAFAKKWITEHQEKEKERPFFMFLSYDTPHATIELPTQAYPSGGGLEGGVQWTGQPGHMINTASGEIDSWVHPDYAGNTWDDDGDPATAAVPWPDTYKRFATVIRRIDDQAGDLRRLLHDLGIEDNTLVVFTTDNGPSEESYLPEEYAVFTPEFFRSYGPFDGIKRDVWEGGVRVPAIVTWPEKFPAGDVNETPVMMSDWLATFAEVAGLQAPERSDGESLFSILSENQAARHPVYVEYFQGGRTPGYGDFDAAKQSERRGQMQMIRLGDLLGIRYDIQSHEDDFRIYDVTEDPGQRHELYKTGQYEDLQKTMKETVLRLRMPDSTAPRPYDEELIPAVREATGLRERGLWRSEFDVQTPWIPSTDRLIPVKRGTMAVPYSPVSSENNLVEYSGFIEAPEAGLYHFKIHTPDQAIVRIHEALVIDHDYNSGGGTEKTGRVYLEQGLHSIRIFLKKEEETGDFRFSVKLPQEADFIPWPEDLLYHIPQR